MTSEVGVPKKELRIHNRVAVGVEEENVSVGCKSDGPKLGVEGAEERGAPAGVDFLECGDIDVKRVKKLRELALRLLTGENDQSDG